MLLGDFENFSFKCKWKDISKTAHNDPEIYLLDDVCLLHSFGVFVKTFH